MTPPLCISRVRWLRVGRVRAFVFSLAFVFERFGRAQQAVVAPPPPSARPQPARADRAPTSSNDRAVPPTVASTTVTVKSPVVELHGYLQPQFGARHRPQALPRDRWEYGGLSTRAGLIVSGNPIASLSYVVHLSLDVRSLLVLTGVDVVDTNGDGASDNVTVARTATTRTLFEEVSVTYRPIDDVSLKMGAMRIPFTVASRSVNTALMFPNRPSANEVFQSGSDQGIIALAKLWQARLAASVGVFTGTSLELAPPNTEYRGLVYSARVDAAPFGKLPEAETDFRREGFRLGVGVGGLLRNGALYTRAGYDLAETRDVRASASFRMAYGGLFVQAEALRRLLTDNVTARPNQASGAYAQASFFVPIGASVGVAPIGRLGFTTEDEATLPRTTVYMEGGLSWFPALELERPETVRLLIQYQGERRVSDAETAHGAIAQAQVLF